MSHKSALIQPERKLSGLHGLRAIAALAVVLFHLKAIASLEIQSEVALFVDHFYLSVQLFFVVSAFSLFHSHRGGQTSTMGYFLKRFFRIAPLFYFLVAFQIWRIYPSPPDWKILGMNLIFVFNFFPGYQSSLVWAGWSVGVEMLFYAMLPLFFWVTLRVHKQLLFYSSLYLACALLSTFIWMYGRAPMGDEFCYMLILSNLAPFAAGLLAYAAFLSRQSQSAAPRRIWLAGSFFVFLFVVAFDPVGLHARIPGLYFASWGIPFGILCVWQSFHPSSILLNRYIQWLADRSFSLYLLHPVVIEYSKPLFADLEAFGLSGNSLYMASTTLTFMFLVPLANVTFTYIEIPGINLGRRLLIGSPEVTQNPKRPKLF